MRTANHAHERVHHNGAALLHAFDEWSRPVSVLLSQAYYAPKLSSLLSVHALLRAKCEVHFTPDKSWVTLPHGKRLPLRRDGNKDYLDFLVPDTSNATTPATHLDEASYASTVPTKNCVDLFAGTSSALQYHALDPHARMLASPLACTYPSPQ